MYYDNNQNNQNNDLFVVLSYWLIGGVSALAFILLLLFGYPTYRVWQSNMAGKAKLAEANQSRQIRITEAKAKKEAAIYEAEAEIERAKGMAKANQIVGSSLQGKEDYLMYLYIQNLEQSKNQIIYIPTEGGMPILEASRLKKQN